MSLPTADPGAIDSGAALRWVRGELGPRPMPAMAVVIGAGDGALLDAIVALRPDVRLLVLEPDPAAGARLAAGARAARFTAEGRWRCLVGPAYAGADEAWRVCPDDPDDHVLLVSPAAASARATALEAARVFGRILFGARANLTARRQFAPRYLTNSIANLGAIARGSRVDALAGAWAGRPAVVVGAGPSLDAVLPVLATLAPRAVVVATDTALRPLLHAGITPQVVVGADPSEHNARHFFSLPPCDETWLVAESALDPAAAAAFAGRTSWFRVADHEPWPWFRDLGVDTAGLDMWGSVLTAAYQTARLAGCDPIAFVGADLAFTGGRPYARGTTYEFDWARSATLGASLDEAWRQQIATAQRVPAIGVDGREVETSLPLRAFRDWIVAHGARAGARVVNATGGGILAGPGIAQVSLADLLRDRAPLGRLGHRSRPTSTVAPARLAAGIAAARTAIARGDRTTPLLARWEAFSLAPLDLAALDGALDHAARVLAAPVLAAEPRAFVPWPALASRGFALDRFHRLPEAVAATAALPDGAAAALPDAAAVAQAALLAAATCQAAAQTAPDPSQPGSSASGDPRHLAWPPAVAWPLRMFEAVLPAAGAPPAGYFDRPVPIERPTDGPLPSPQARLTAELTARWLRAAAGTDPSDGRARLRGVAHLIAACPEDAPATAVPAAALTIHLRSGDTGAHTVARRLARQAAARVLTGCLVASPDDRGRVCLAAVDLVTAGATVDVAGVAALVTPRVLTEEGLAPATSAVMVAGGVVVVPLHADHSVWIGEDGARRRHLTWPAPIVGELPMGEGAIAWSNGTASWPVVGDGYVLYRTTPDGPVRRDALPFRPTAGAWFAGKVYWNVFRHGLGVWAPGTAPELRLEGESFGGVTVDGSRLHAAPIARDPEGRVVRRIHAEAWVIDADGAAARQALPPEGASVAVAAGARWTARACPDVDLVRLDAGTRRIDLVCHHPMAVAWAGRSLVVCTAAGDVLLFERLTDTLATLG